MKFNINQAELQNSLTVVSKGTSTRSTLPILSGILIRAYNNTVTFEGTDLNLSIRNVSNALVEEEGEVVVPSKLLVDIVKSLPDEAIHIQTSDVDESLTILCGAASFSLKTMAAQDFPSFPEIKTETTLSLSYSDFSSMVKRVAKVVSRDESRAILTGVFIQVENNTLKMVATDSYRLALTEASIDGLPDTFEAVISGSFLQDVSSLPTDGDTIQLSVNENQILITYGDTTFINRRIEGTYPNYNQLLPSSYETRVQFETSHLLDAVKRTSLLSNRTAPVKFDINAASATTQISTTSQDIGAARETLGSTVEGNDVEIAFNSSYILEGLSSIETNQVYLELQDSMKPGIFRAVEGENFLYLIMPVRLS